MLNNNTSLFNYNGYVTTVTHIEVDLKDPQPQMICLDDIVTGLAHNNHWNGQTRELLTVAQHSVMVLELFKQAGNENLYTRKLALLHDAPEAYIGDLPKPFKELCGDRPKQIERGLLHAIIKKFGMADRADLNLKLGDIKPFDKLAQQMEWQYLFKDKGDLPGWMHRTFNTATVWSAKFAREKFISSFIELWGQEFTNKVFNPGEVNEI